MTRNATLSLDGFDPDVLEAARDVARRAGVPVETWIASIVEPETAPHQATPQQAAAREPTRPDKPAASVARSESPGEAPGPETRPGWAAPRAWGARP